MWEHLSLQVRRSGVRTIDGSSQLILSAVSWAWARRQIGKAPACGRWCWQKLTAFKTFGCGMYQRREATCDMAPQAGSREVLRGIPDDALFPFRLLCFRLTIIYMEFFS